MLVLYLVTSCTQQKEYNPQIDSQNFVAAIDNPYYTLTPGTTFTYQSITDEGTETIITVVTNATRVIKGITAVIVWDRVWLDDELIEETYDWYAQDKEGNVWYLGEDSKEYENDQVKSTKGSWETGVDGALPGIIMRANPIVGESYRQEYYKSEAEDMANVLSLDETVIIGNRTFTNCLKTRDWSSIDSQLSEHKYYCPEVGGIVLETAVAGGERTELITIERG